MMIFEEAKRVKKYCFKGWIRGKMSHWALAIGSHPNLEMTCISKSTKRGLHKGGGLSDVTLGFSLIHRFSEIITSSTNLKHEKRRMAHRREWILRTELRIRLGMIQLEYLLPTLVFEALLHVGYHRVYEVTYADSLGLGTLDCATVLRRIQYNPT